MTKKISEKERLEAFSSACSLQWNGMIQAILQAESIWRELSLNIRGRTSAELQSLNITLQKNLPNVHSEFYVAVIRLIEKQRGYGTLGDLLIPLETEEEKTNG